MSKAYKWEDECLVKFSRCKPYKKTSWPYRVFNQYYEEQKWMYQSFDVSSKFTYRMLKEQGAKWEDLANQHLSYTPNQLLTLKSWSDSFNNYMNWNNLNQLLSLNSYFETYIASVINLAFEFDPGLLVKAPHSIDGIKQIKKGIKNNSELYQDYIMKCTKGGWNCRITNLHKIFEPLPKEFNTYMQDLENIRRIRNNVGHAFGRDIRNSRKYNNPSKIKMEPLSKKRFLRYSKIVHLLAHKLDKMMMEQYIGNFLPLYYYHKIIEKLPPSRSNKGIKMMAIKKSLGTDTEEMYSKDFCRWIVSYYERL